MHEIANLTVMTNSTVTHKYIRFDIKQCALIVLENALIKQNTSAFRVDIKLFELPIIAELTLLEPNIIRIGYVHNMIRTVANNYLPAIDVR